MSILETLNDSIEISVINENIGSIYEDLLQWKLALRHFKLAYDFVGKTSYKEKSNILNNIGDVYRKQGLLQEGKKYTLQALDEAKQVDDLIQIASSNTDLAKTYALIGDYTLAYQHLLEAGADKEKILRNKYNSQATNLQAIYESNKKEVKIQLLKEQNKLVV